MNNAQPVAYIRRSVASRADPGDVSREFQTDAVRKLAGADADRLRIIDADWGRSASTDKTGKRLAFLAMLEEIEAGAVSALYAYSTDRLARSVEVTARLLNACRRARVPIVTREGRIEPGDASATLLFHVLASVNENALSGMEAKANASIAIRKARNIAAGREPNAGMGRKVYGPEITAAVLAAFDRAGSFLGATKILNAANATARAAGEPEPYPTMLGLKNKEGTPNGYNVLTVSRICRRERPDMPRKGRQGGSPRTTRALSGLLLCGGTLEDGRTCGAILSSMPRPGKRSPAMYCRVAHNNASHSRPYVISSARLMPALKAEGAHYRAPADEYTDAIDRAAELAVLQADRARIQKMAARGMLDLDEAEGMLRENKTQTDALSADAMRHDLPQAIPWNAEPAILNAALRGIWTSVQLSADLLPVDGGTIWRFPDWRRP
jgi:DNA invertase Pin-like site-specific DNA recombinase